MKWKVPTVARVANYWSMNTDTMGVYGNYYLKRAIVAQLGLGANLPEDAIYPLNLADETGKPLDGANQYTIHFEKGATPPVRAFWSITLYDSDGFQVGNVLNRFAVSSWMPFKYNADGSLDLYFQSDSPGKDKEANWLPAPKAPFNLTMRLYSPQADALDGQVESASHQESKTRAARDISSSMTEEDFLDARSWRFQHRDCHAPQRAWGTRESSGHAILEIVEALVLAIVAIATAWSGYQAALWTGHQSELYGQASKLRVQAEGAATAANQERLYNASTVVEWLKAEAQGQKKLSDLFERRFLPEFRPAFEAWKKTDPLNNPNAPAGSSADDGIPKL